MNTFALATLTLSTLCLGGAFAAIVTARHVRLRRDAEDRRALGRVLEDVDQRLARLAAAEESSATAQIVGRLARLDERLAELASDSAESAERTRRVEEAQRREHDERLAERRAASAAPHDEVALAEESDGAESPAAPDRDEAPRAASPAAEEDDPELAALLAKFDDDAFSFRGAARSKPKGGSGPGALAPRAGGTQTLEPALAPVAERALAAVEDASEEAALVVDAESDDLNEAVLDEAEVLDAADAADEALLDEAFAAEHETPLAPAAADDTSFAAGATGQETSADAEPDTEPHEATRDGIDVDDDDDDVDDELALDDLVLFFHEDDQGEPNDTSADDVALFDELPLQAHTDADSQADAQPEPQIESERVNGEEAAGLTTLADVASPVDTRARASVDDAPPIASAPAGAPAAIAERPAPLAPADLRRSIDELRSLTDRLSAPQRDRSERQRLVAELRDALARVRR